MRDDPSRYEDVVDVANVVNLRASMRIRNLAKKTRVRVRSPGHDEAVEVREILVAFFLQRDFGNEIDLRAASQERGYDRALT